MQPPLLSWQLAATGAPSSLRHPPLSPWQRALAALRPPVWPAAAAALMVLGLLVAFQQVVAQGVEQAEQRRAATASQHESTWRCKLVHEPAARDNCLAQIGTEMAAMPIKPRSRLAALTLPSPARPLEK
jgi:hypothetical protein